MSDLDSKLFERIAKRLSEAPPSAEAGTPALLTSTANRYGSKPEGQEPDEHPSFDPQAAALFEATIEAAYLVANADGEFDAAEQQAFRQVVGTACGGAVPERQLAAILADLEQQLADDGMDKRIQLVARTIATPDHAREVLRVAALVAHISQGVSDVERQVMQKLARELELNETVLDQALREVEVALKD